MSHSHSPFIHWYSSISLILIIEKFIQLDTLLDDIDPLAPSKNSSIKTPQSFLGENSALVNLDQLLKTSAPTNNGQAAYNPFGDLPQPPKTNLFQQQIQPVNTSSRLLLPIQ